jgi:hypothetical protein
MPSIPTAMFQWWINQMPKYTRGLTVAGVLAFIVYWVTAVSFKPFELSFDTAASIVVIQVIGFLLMIGVTRLFFHTLCPLIELFIEPSHPERFRSILFGLVFGGSVAILFSVPLILAFGHGELFAD